MARVVFAVVFVAVLAVAVSAWSPRTREQVSSVEPAVQQWRDFVRTYGKRYSAQQYAQRFAIFRANLDTIAALNKEHADRGTRFGVNAFADLTLAEFNSLYKGLNTTALAQARKARRDESAEVRTPAVTCPPSGNSTCDWRVAGAVTPIKNQGQCGSCWSFSATGSTEGAHFLTKKKLVSLSEQNLVDCSQAEGNNGCGGGLMDYAFEYIIKNKGIDTEASYPYTAQDGKCVFNAANVGSKLSSYKDVTQNSETALQTAITSVGPISVAIDASHSSFQFYTGGVYYEPACSSTQLDHGVLAVGIGAQGTSAYYLVKNSWGTSWGMQGFILMSANKSNNCGIATMSSYPIV